MEIGYKLMDAQMRTFNRTCQWALGVTKTVTGRGDMCGPGWLHSYRDPLLAVLLDPIHGNYGSDARLFKVECGGRVKQDRGLKFGNAKQTLVEEVVLPRVTIWQRVQFAKNCAEFAARAVKGPRLSPDQIHEELRKCAYAAIGQEVPA